MAAIKNYLKLKKGPRLLFKVTSIIIFTLGLLQLGLYFGSDWLLRGYLQQQVEKMSEGKYSVDFDRFYLSLIQRGFFVKNFTLFPLDTAVFEAEQTPYYQIMVKEIDLKQLSFNKENKRIEVGELRLTSPIVQSRQDQNVLEEENISPLQLLEAEIQKSFGPNLDEVHIKGFYVDNADLLMENFISQKSITASNTDLYVQDIRVSKERKGELPFNVGGFALHLTDFEIQLADSIHRVLASSVGISSLEKEISADRVQILPDLSQEADVYYEFALENLRLEDADIYKMFQTSEVEIGDLHLQSPNFRLYTDRTAGQEKERTTDLYQLIKDVLTSISIDELKIDKGKFVQRGVKDPNKNRIEAEEIRFLMEKVYIGPDLDIRKDNFFYSQNAVLEISRAKIALADEIHWILGEKIFLSSYDDKVSISNVDLMPLTETDTLSEATLFEIKIPQLDFSNANLRKIYNEKIVDIGELIIESPEILLKDIIGNRQDTTLFAGASLQDLSKGFLNAIYVDRLEMTDGSLVLDNNLRIRKDSLSFGKINFVLENLQLDEQQNKDMESRIFFADHLRLEIEDYALKLSDNLHLFAAERILIDTREEILYIDGFHLKPFLTDVRPVLERYGKTTALDIEIPHFSATGVDINQAYFEDQLFVKHIDIPSPIIQWTKYIPDLDEEESERMERGDILNLITNYFSVIQVDSLTVDEGTFVYDNFANERFRSFAENDIAITIKNFYLDKETDHLDNRTLFSEEVDVNLNNYVFNIADGKYSIVAERVGFNSAREEINTFNVKLMPNRYLDSKVSIEAMIPDMRIKGVDLEAFLFDNTLSLSQLILSDANVRLSINRNFEMEEEKEENDSDRRSRKLPKTIDIIMIDSILAANARFSVAYFEEGKDLDLITTGINMSFSDFLLDSARLTKGDIAGFFDNMTMELDDFSLALQDSIHTINFSKIELNSEGDEIILENLQVNPNTYVGIKGTPIFKGHIPQVKINTRSLTSFQGTGQFDVESIFLSNPDLMIYVDEGEEKEEVLDVEEEIKELVLERVNINNFEIEGGKLAIKEKSDTTEVNSFNNFSIVLNDLKFDLTRKQELDTDFFLSNDYAFELKDFVYDLPDSLNRLRVGLVSLSKGMMKLQDVRLLPRLGKFEYVREVGTQTDVAEVFVPNILITGLNVKRLINKNSMVANKMQLMYPEAELFRDKRFPEDGDTSKVMPQELMVGAGRLLDLDTLMVSDGKVRYREFPEKGMVPGEITFSEMNALMVPFRTGSRDKVDEKSRLSGSFKINCVAEINLEAHVDYHPPYPIAVEAKVGEFELAMINSILESNAFVTVERGWIESGEWNFVADNHHALGEMTLRYRDLKVRLLDERTLLRGGGRKSILTFVINFLALRKNNPRKIFNRLVSSPIYEERDKSKFIFNYMWKATFSGLMGSSGLMQPKIPRKEEESKEDNMQ
ncbi:MAG: hypothetical protein WD398_04835 [Cyclobacteriaceae bacterium]